MYGLLKINVLRKDIRIYGSVQVLHYFSYSLYSKISLSIFNELSSPKPSKCNW